MDSGNHTGITTTAIHGEKNDTVEPDEVARPVSRRRIRTGIVIALSVSVVAIVVILFLTMDRATWTAVSQISPVFLAVAFVLVALRWLATAFRTQILVRASGSEIGFGKTVKVVLSGGFTGSVTPFHAGGIPTEIYFLTVYGIPGGQATAVVTAGAAVSMLVFVVAMPIILVLSASTVHVSLGIRTLLVVASIVGFFALLVVVYSMRDPDTFAERVGKHTPAFLKRRQWFPRAVEWLADATEEFSEGLRTILSYRRSRLGAAVLLTSIFWGIGFFVTPVILWGLGRPDLFGKALLGQLVVSGLLPFVPVPGESGVAELAFAGVFALFVPKDLVGFMTLAWRFFMLYLVMLGTGIAFILALRDAARKHHASRAITVKEDTATV